MTTTDQIALAKELAAKDARIAALEEALRDAPHDRKCPIYDDPTFECECWKATVRALLDAPNTASSVQPAEGVTE